jgi:hypothetical protein
VVTLPGFGQGARLARGIPIELAAGNGVHSHDVVSVENPPSFSGRTGRTSFGGRRGIVTNPVAFSVPHPPVAVQADGAHRLLQMRDRHPYLDAGTSRKGSDESNSGVPNPLASGPARPTLRVSTRNETWQIGNDLTRFEDNTTPFPTVDIAPGRPAAGTGRTPHGTQSIGERRRAMGTLGDTWNTKNGGTPGLHRPYGSRGVTIGPPPGTPLDGPQRLRGGFPRGRHSPTIPDHQLARIKYYSGAPQQRGVRAGRPSNSKIAGQSYNQTVVHQGVDGPNPMPRVSVQVRTPGLSGRWARQ